jgi:hypothetical protein
MFAHTPRKAYLNSRTVMPWDTLGSSLGPINQSLGSTQSLSKKKHIKNDNDNDNDNDKDPLNTEAVESLTNDKYTMTQFNKKIVRIEENIPPQECLQMFKKIIHKKNYYVLETLLNFHTSPYSRTIIKTESSRCVSSILLNKFSYLTRYSNDNFQVKINHPEVKSHFEDTTCFIDLHKMCKSTDNRILIHVFHKIKCNNQTYYICDVLTSPYLFIYHFMGLINLGFGHDYSTLREKWNIIPVDDLERFGTTEDKLFPNPESVDMNKSKLYFLF